MVRGDCLRDGGILGIEEGDFNHEWARIFTNGEGEANGRDGGNGCGVF